MQEHFSLIRPEGLQVGKHLAEFVDWLSSFFTATPS
jgi:hypothetical protein